MNPPEISYREQSKRIRIPRWMAPLFWVVGISVVHGGMPWALSLLTSRHGWTEGRPGILNLLASILVMVGSACLIWVLVLHFIRAPEGWEMERTPKYLLRSGPYSLTRNPMYLAALVLWLGWALFYGSFAVLIGFLVLGVVFNFIVVPWEDRNLEARFGESYLRYKSSVHRWFGKKS